MAQLLGHFHEKQRLGSPSSASVYLLAKNGFEPWSPLPLLGLLTPKQPEESHPCLVSFANPPLNFASKSKQVLPEVPKQAIFHLSLFLILIQTIEHKLNSRIFSTVPFAGLRDFCFGQIMHLPQMFAKLQPQGYLNEKSLPGQAWPCSELRSPLLHCSVLCGLHLLAQSLLFGICPWIQSWCSFSFHLKSVLCKDSTVLTN